MLLHINIPIRQRMNSAVSQLVTIVHQEPQNFGTVWGVEALNGMPIFPSLSCNCIKYANHLCALEPPTDGSQTPGYFTFMQQFVTAVRNAENALGVPASSQLSATFMDVSW